MSATAGERRLLVIAGATATGKTEVAESVAGAVDGIVVCADARQVFAELDIGTGKPSPAERARRPHALFDWRRLGDPLSAGAWARAAAEVCERAFAAGRTPVLVGGSGLYLRALLEGLHGEPGSDPAVRADLEAEAARDGIEALHERLGRSDPETAARLAPRDRQRILRALEVGQVTGRPLSAWNAQPRQPLLAADARVLELTASPARAAERIAARTAWMFASGLLEETRGILAAGLGDALRALRAIGYDEAMAVLESGLPLAEAEARTNLRTRQLAKRQRTWFRHQLPAERLDTDTASPGGLAAEALLRLRAGDGG